MKKNLNKILKAGLISVITIGSGFAFGVLVALSGLKWVAITTAVALAVALVLIKFNID